MCTSSLSLTPVSSQMELGNPNTEPSDSLIFQGPIGDSGVGLVRVLLDSHLFTTTNLIGVPLRAQGWHNTLGCFTQPYGNVPGEPYVVGMTVLRDPEVILTASGASVFTPGGNVVYDASLMPELKLGWVSQPSEACIYRQIAFELTVVETGQKVLAFWNSRTSLEIGGQGYSFWLSHRFS